MTRIEVDYNERDKEGRVIAGVSADLLLVLREGEAVTLYDPIDRLRADATVAWIEPDAHAVGFDVDWGSFEDEDLPEQEPVARAVSGVQSARTASVRESSGSSVPTKPARSVRGSSRGERRGTLPAHSAGNVFISYRREDTGPYARLLEGFLGEHLPGTHVFMDQDSIEAGTNLTEVIESAVGSSVVFIALIGRQWLTSVDDYGQRRLDDPDDYVRSEIQAALQRRVRVILVLVDGARVPRPQQLPNDLRQLARLHALEMSYSPFEYDETRLRTVIQMILAPGTSDARK
jgi:hypothetical protein